MTPKQLNDMGFTKGSFINEWFHWGTEVSVRIPDLKTIDTPKLMARFYEAAFDKGVVYGRTQKADEIKQALFIST